MYLLCIGYSRIVENFVLSCCFVVGLSDVFELEINTETSKNITVPSNSGEPRNFVRGRGGAGFQQIQLRTEGRENGDLGGGSL